MIYVACAYFDFARLWIKDLLISYTHKVLYFFIFILLSIKFIFTMMHWQDPLWALSLSGKENFENHFRVCFLTCFKKKKKSSPFFGSVFANEIFLDWIAEKIPEGRNQ